MNFFSAFQSEVFKPLVTLLIPGGIAVSTWFVGLLWTHPKLLDLVSRNHTEAGWVLLLVIIGAGVVIEDWGSRVESHFDTKADKATGSAHTQNWFKYLRSAFVADPIGRRYIRTVVLRLKFELGMVFALAISAIGLAWLMFLGLSCRLGIILILLCLAFAAWELFEAKAGHELLAECREELLKKIRVVSTTGEIGFD
jgi:hypothetical protein